MIVLDGSILVGIVKLEDDSERLIDLLAGEGALGSVGDDVGGVGGSG